MRFVLVSRFLAVVPGRSATAIVRFDPEDELFADHFPGFPLVPGVLLTEAMGQTAGGMLIPVAGEGRWPLLVMIERAKFRRPVSPGEEIRLEATVLAAREGSVWRVATEALVADRRVAEAVLVLHSVPVPQDGDQGGAFRAWAMERGRANGLVALLDRSAEIGAP